jgi:hypothetical protein
VSVRRTVGLPERSAAGSGRGRRLLRAGGWATSVGVIVGGSLLLYQMLFTADGELEGWLSSPVAGSAGPRAITNADPDLPSKELLAGIGQPPAAAQPVPPVAAQPVGTDVDAVAGDSPGSGPGSPVGSPGVPPGEESTGSGSGGDGDSSGHGSGGGDSSGHGSGGDGDSSGHGSGDRDSGRGGGDADCRVGSADASG